MIDVKVDLPNIEELVKRVGEAEADAASAMAKAIHAGADERVPKDTGKLAKSGRTESRRDGSAAVIYGNSEVTYAASVHENPAVQPRAGSKRFLRDSLMESRKLLRLAAASLGRIFK